MPKCKDFIYLFIKTNLGNLLCQQPLRRAQNLANTLTPAPTFTCGICMDELTEETSTKCGHIFCKKCIDAAIAAQHKCPSCRQKLNKRDTLRVYLPKSGWTPGFSLLALWQVIIRVFRVFIPVGLDEFRWYNIDSIKIHYWFPLQELENLEILGILIGYSCL